MGWVNSDEWQEQEEQEHSRESKQMRGSDAGHAGQRSRSLLSSMATAVPVQQVHQVQWMVPIDDSSMVRESIQNWNTTRLRAGLQCNSKSVDKALGIGPVSKVQPCVL